MQFLLLVYTEDALIEALPEGRYDTMMKACLEHADDLQRDGTLLDFKQLEAPGTARSVRIRNGRTTVVDGPFAETKELLGGFNLIEADDMDEAVRIAADLPWATTGCIEVRAVRDVDIVRKRVGSPLSRG
jgi:hypothetical protein